MMIRKCGFLALILLFLFSGCLAILSVHADSTYQISVCPIDQYYLKGQTATFLIDGTPSAFYTLTVLDPSMNPVLTKNRQLDSNGHDSFSFTVPSNIPYGFYSVRASIPGAALSTAYITLLNTENWTPTSFPFIKTHLGITYTISAKGFEADSSSGKISLNYPSLPVSFSVNAFSNDMALVERLKNTDLGIGIDLTYAFIHSGMKIIINGSVPQATTYTFKFSVPNQILNALDRLRDGNLVFDWSDLRKAAHAFTYNQETKALTVNIPKTFSLDPYVFQDGFETGDFSAWTGRSASNGNLTQISIVTSPVHHGTYACSSYLAASGNYKYTYKLFSQSYSAMCARGYVQWANLPTNTGEAEGCLWLSNGTDFVGKQIVSARIVKNSTGQTNWGMMYMSGGSFNINNPSSPVQTGVWYSVEIRSVVSATVGEARLLINDVEVATATGFDSTGNGLIGYVAIGVYAGAANPNAFTVYHDCVVADPSAIGQEVTNTAPTIGSFAAPSTVYANKYEFFNVTANDVDGKTDLRNVTVQLNGSAQFTWLNSTGAFSEASDPSNIFTLDAANSVKTDVNTTAVTLSWKLKPYWNYSEGSVNANGTVYDAANASGAESKTGMFTFEDDLIISSVTHLPGQPAAGQQITLTGQIYYEGTATPPEDATGITAYAVRNNTATQVGSTSTFTAGAFSMSWQEGTDGTYGYDVYCVTDEATTQNSTEIIYVEKIITGQLPHDIIIPNNSNDNSTDNSGVSDLGPGWTLPIGFNLAAPILIFSCLVAIVCYDGYEKDFKLSGTSKSWSKHKGKSRKMGGLFSKRKTDKKTEWKEKKPWD